MSGQTGEVAASRRESFLSLGFIQCYREKGLLLERPINHPPPLKFHFFFLNLVFLIKVSRDKTNQLTCCGRATRCQAMPSLSQLPAEQADPWERNHVHRGTSCPCSRVSRKQAASCFLPLCPGSHPFSHPTLDKHEKGSLWESP